MSSSTNPRQSSFNPRASISTSNYKPRQYAHLQAQLAQLQANLADTEELLQMTRTQAENIKILGGLHGGLYVSYFTHCHNGN